MSEKQVVEEIEVNDEMVVAAATDINEVLKPEPLLDLEKPGEELQKEIEELFGDIRKGDVLSKETWKTLKGLGWVEEKPKAEVATENKPEAKVKAEKTKSAIKVPKEDKVYTKFGHRGVRATLVDEAIARLKKAKVSEIAEKTKLPKGFVRAHMLHLVKVHGLSLHVIED